MAQSIWSDALQEVYDRVDELVDSLSGEGDEFRGAVHKLQEAQGPLSHALSAAQQAEGVDPMEGDG